MNVTLRQLRAFLAVAEAGQFTLAASHLHLSQSALSGLVKDLENELDVRLLDRHTRSVRLTESGRLFLEHTRRVLLELDQALQLTRDTTRFNRGRVKVACSTVLSSTLVVPFFAAFRAVHPGVRLELIDVAEQNIPRAVLDESADIGIGTQAQTDLEILATPLFQDVYCVVMHPEHRLASRRSVPWRALEDEPWIALSPSSPIRRQIDAHLTALGIRTMAAYEVSFPGTVLSMVRQGLGLSILATNVQQMMDAQDLCFRPLASPVPKRVVATFRQKQRALSPAAQRFHDLLVVWVRDHLHRLSPPARREKSGGGAPRPHRPPRIQAPAASP